MVNNVSQTYSFDNSDSNDSEQQNEWVTKPGAHLIADILVVETFRGYR